jgi:hypothetical protein
MAAYMVRLSSERSLLSRVTTASAKAYAYIHTSSLDLYVRGLRSFVYSRIDNMAEILGIVASSITVAEASAKTGFAVLKLKRLWDEIQNVPDTITDLMAQVEVLDPIIWEMEHEINETRSAISPLLYDDAGIRKSTQYCRQAVDGLTSIVNDLHAQVNAQQALRRRKAKIKVVLKSDVLHIYEKRLRGAVNMLGIAQQSYMM